MFVLNPVLSWGVGQDPRRWQCWPHWLVPALLSAAGSCVSPAPQLCPGLSSVLLPNPPPCHSWPFCELDQASSQHLLSNWMGSGLLFLASKGMA